MSRQIVLSVEDDEATAYMIKLAFKEVAPEIELRRAVDGDQALELLREFCEAGRVQPALILMNLNLPKRTGFELLEEIREGELFQSVPVVIFSSSSLDSDKARCLASGAKAFFTKPATFDGVIETVQSVCKLMQPLASPRFKSVQSSAS
ncbi:MAG: histidine kinase [Bryobacterales bacterium]|jgi:two-component system, response regulator|nr:histidine kinase [Bryobacterales bacterium]